MIDSVLMDARYALHGLRRNPVLACSVVLTLMITSAAAAMLRPALRASKWDPAQSLRQD